MAGLAFSRPVAAQSSDSANPLSHLGLTTVMAYGLTQVATPTAAAPVTKQANSSRVKGAKHIPEHSCPASLAKLATGVAVESSAELTETAISQKAFRLETVTFTEGAAIVTPTEKQRLACQKS